jgi:hypothetical protein
LRNAAQRRSWTFYETVNIAGDRIGNTAANVFRWLRFTDKMISLFATMSRIFLKGSHHQPDKAEDVSIKRECGLE